MSIRKNPLMLVSDDRYDSIVKKISTAVEERIKIAINYLNTLGYNLSLTNKEYREALENADIIFPDGIGVWFAEKYFSNQKVNRFNWTDQAYNFLNLCSEKRWKIYFLGSTDEILSCAVKKLANLFPTLLIVGTTNGYEALKDENLVNTINEKAPDILWVGLGTPKQELWIYQNKQKLNIPVIQAVGDIYSFLAEKRTRGPILLRHLGFEWFFRLISHPKRYANRYAIGIPVFFFNLIKQKFFR